MCGLSNRYGWIDKQVAVIPRIVKSMKCGRNNIGLITWRAPIKTPFHVFCFNLTGTYNLYIFNYNAC